MKKIKIIIEKNRSGYSAYAKDFTVATTCKTMEKLRANMLEALNLYFENQENTSHEITGRQRKILRERLASIYNETADLVSWQTVKNNIKKAKRAISSK
ncbi:MAG TPA: hypothetical protein VE978_23065 [Chitinophagales bacterium]|nr:hypothetical protein [Chitinophagales bacterium]